MKRKGRVIVVLLAVVALALLGALYWHSPGRAGSDRVGLQQEEMAMIVAGFKPKPKPTPTPNPAHVLYTFTLYMPGWPLKSCSVDLLNPSGGAIAEDPLCRIDSLGNGVATIRMLPGSIGSFRGYGVGAGGLDGTSARLCRTEWRSLNGGTSAGTSCLPY